MQESIIFYCMCNVVVKKVHVRYLISWWVSCQNRLTFDEVIAKIRHHVLLRRFYLQGCPLNSCCSCSSSFCRLCIYGLALVVANRRKITPRTQVYARATYLKGIAGWLAHVWSPSQRQRRRQRCYNEIRCAHLAARYLIIAVLWNMLSHGGLSPFRWTAFSFFSFLFRQTTPAKLRSKSSDGMQ